MYLLQDEFKGGRVTELKVLSTDQLGEMKPPEWLMWEFYAEASTTVVYGKWGLGKSFMVLDQVLTASTGAAWYGERTVARPLKTLYVVAEGAAWWYKRIVAYEEARGPIDRDNLLWIPEPVDLWTPHGDKQGQIEELEEVLAEHHPDLMVFDTWVRNTAAFGMNEDKANDTAQVIRQLDRLRDEYTVTPVIVHHPTKMGGARGSGNLLASVERVVELVEVDKDPYSFDVKDEKGNHLEPFQTFRLRFEGVDIPGDRSAVVRYEGQVVDGDANDVLMLAGLKGAYAVDVPFTYSDIKRVTSVKEGSVSATVKKLVNMGKLRKTDEGYELTEEA